MAIIYLLRTVTWLLLAAASLATAAPLTPADRDSIEQQQWQILEQNQQQRQALERSQAPIRTPATPPMPTQGPCFSIHTITLSGATLLSTGARRGQYRTRFPAWQSAGQQRL
ncbi:hypothetical protein [Paramixta manurensis]|uniref:hypothetical protein n=1 Tax=Paramixta manurensis TaxID=2740817 RepID=UPI00156ACA68